MDDELVYEMMMLFEGYHKAYGSYDPRAAKSDMRGGKVEIKSTAYSRREPPTQELWRLHLEGTQPLGIIPIRDNNTVRWGCIDIDLYGIDVVELMKQIEVEKLPLICCKTKSGGVHVFLFMAEPVDADQMRIGLRNIAAVLRHGGSEIFPKQAKVAWNKGDLGSWLNMPYFGDDRWAYRPDGTFMGIKEFVALAESLKQPKNWFEQGEERTEYSANSARGGLADFKDGPPCMQHISAIGLGEGGRNTGLYAFGIFAKKKFPNNWEEVLEGWNQNVAQPPLPATELVDIIKRLRNKDYNYPCKDQPIVAHCNSAVCRTRKYGVGGTENELPVVNGLSKLMADPPVWFLDVGGERVELNTEQLMNYKSFQKVCVDKLTTVFHNMSQVAWLAVIAKVMSEVTLIETSDEVSISGQFLEILDEFVNDSHRAKQKEDLLNHRPWLDDSEPESKKHKHYFRLGDLQKFLGDNDFNHYTRGQIVSELRSLGGDKEVFTLKGQFVRTWWVPYHFTTHRKGRIDTPHMEASPI
jgi:hypothetical protein